MSFNKVSLATPHLSLYIEGEQGLVFNHVSQISYQLSTLAVAVFLALDEGLTQQELLENLKLNSSASDIEITESYQLLTQVFDISAAKTSYLDGEYPELKTLPYNLTLPQNSDTYLIGDTSFSVKCEILELKSHIQLLLQPLAVERLQADFNLVIKPALKNDEKCYNIYCNGLLVESGIQAQEVFPLVIDRMQILTFQHHGFMACFHGAGLKIKDKNVLLPGKSGVGKSTLCAQFACEGGVVYSDEMIALDLNFNLKPLSLPIAVKEGSWNILSSLYPDLNKAHTWLRIDGRKVKYIWPPKFVEKAVTTKRSSSNYIISPTYNPLKPGSAMQALSIIDCIKVLVDSGYQLGIFLTEAKLERLLNFFSEAQRYKFNYQSTEQAAALLYELLETSTELS